MFKLHDNMPISITLTAIYIIYKSQSFHPLLCISLPLYLSISERERDREGGSDRDRERKIQKETERVGGIFYTTKVTNLGEKERERARETDRER